MDRNTRDQRSGEPVKTGNYRAILTVTNTVTGRRDRAERVLYSRTGFDSTRHTSTRTGKQTATRSHSRDCYIDPEYYGGGLSLDCWGGTEAVVTYGFRVPSNATRVSWGVSGERGCCNGLVNKTARRSGSLFTIRVRVTNWAEYTVNRASVSYTTAVRR